MMPCDAGRPSARTLFCPHDQRQQFLLLAEPEFGGLLERIASVTACISECDRVGFRALRLQEQRGKIVGPDRVPGRTEHVAAVVDELVRELLFEIVAECIVGGDEVDRFDVLLRHRSRAMPCP